MIKNQSTRRLFGLISTALTASILMQWLIIPEIKWDSNVLADTEILPTNMDSTSAYNYSKVLSYGSDYGIITEELNKFSHMETTYAAMVFNGTDNTDIDFITSPAHFLVGALGENSELAFGTNSLQEGGPGYCDEFYIEAPDSVLNTIRYMEGFRESDTTVHRITRTQEQVNNSIQTLLNNAGSYASAFDTRAGSSSYAFPSAYIYNESTLPDGITDPSQLTTSYIYLHNGDMVINLTSNYEDRVVYINVDSEDMLRAIAKNNGVTINKPDSTIVVFNFDEGFVLTGEARHYDCDIFINQITVNGLISKTAAGGKSCDPANTYTDVDSQICRTIIWNVPDSRSVALGDLGGLLNAPYSAVQSREGSTNGWIIAKTMDVHVEHHFLFQDTSRASMGDFQFYLTKSLTLSYGRNDEYTADTSHPVVQPYTSVPVRAGEYSFIWQETQSDYSTPIGSSSTASTGSVSSEPARVYFPHISFFSDEAHATDAHYVTPGTTRSFYFHIYEDQNVGVDGISNSDGYVNIQLDVTESSGVYTYVVSTVSYTGDADDEVFIYNARSNVDAVGSVYNLGSFYNLFENGVDHGSLTINKIVTIDNGNYTNEFGNNGPAYYFTVTRQIGNTLYYYGPSGNRSTTPQTIEITSDEMHYWYSGHGSVVVNLPVGEYTVTEVTDASASQVVNNGNTYVLATTSYDVSGTSTQAVGVTANTNSDISVTNDYSTSNIGYLQVTKILTDGTNAITVPAATEFTFDVYQGTDTSVSPVRTITVTIPQGDSTATSTPIAVPQGDYTIVESTQGSISGYTYASVSPSSAPVTVDSSNAGTDSAATATFTNTYTAAPATGYLQVTKNLTDGTAAITVPADTVFTFNVYQGTATTGTPYATITLTVPQGSSSATSTPIEVPQGSYTVVEATQGTISGYTYASVSPTSASVTVGTGNTTTATAANATFTNTYTSTAPATGYLQVTKNLTDGTAAITVPADTEFTFNVYQGTATTGTPYRTITVTVPQGSSSATSTPIEVPQGSYTVVEASQGTISGYTYASVSPTSASVTVGTGNTTTATAANATFTNTYTAQPQFGYLAIEKTVDGINGQGGSGPDLTLINSIEFTVSGPDAAAIGNIPPLNQTNVDNNTWVRITNTNTYRYVIPVALHVGDLYRISESADGHNSNYSVVVSPASSAQPVECIIVAGDRDNAVVASFTNTYTAVPANGYLQVTKNLTDGTAAITVPADTEFTFNVYQGTATTGTPYRTITVTVPQGSSSATSTPIEVPQGNYTVVEATQGTISGYTYASVSPTSASVTVGTGNTTTATAANATFTNTYTSTAPATGYLQVTKNLTDGTAAITVPADTEFTFNVYQGTATTGTPYTTITVTVPQGSSSATSTPIEVPQGSYTVVEASQGTISGYTYASVSPTSASVTVGTGNTTTATAANATFTNTYTSTAPANGYLQVTKNLTDGTAAITVPADTEFTFNVYQGTATTGTPYRTITVTVPQGSSSATSTPIEVPQGNYTVVEATQGTISGYTYASVSPTSASVTVGTGNTTTATAANATFTNTYTSTAPAVTGSLKINKTVDGLGSDTLDAVTNFEFTVTWVDTSVTPNVTYYYYLNNGTTEVSRDEHTVVVRIAAGQVSGSVQLDGLIAGRAYTVTEVSGRIPASVVAGGNSYDYQSTTGEGNVSVTAANIPTNPATADVVNTYSASQPQPSTCNIDIDKTTVGGVEVAGATITLTNTNGTDLSGCTVGGGAQSSSISGNVITFVSGSNGVTTIVGLPDGDYVLEETIVPTVSGGTYTVATTIGFTINSGSVVDSSVTGITDGNGYQPSTGTANAVFVLFDNFTADPTQTTPSETTPSDTTPTETTPTETSSEDTQPAVPQYGCLVISKTISGTSLNELETITFVLTDTSCGATREVPALTLANVQSGLWGDAGNGTYYYIVEGLSAGVTYTVTESLDGHTSTYSLDAVNSITTGSAMIVANGTVYVNLTDAYVTGDGTTPTESSSSDESNPSDETSETTAPEVSSVTLDGQPLSPDSYTVNPDGTITLNDAVIRSLGSGDHTIVITYVNGATRTQTVHVDGADRDVAETGETSVNAVAAVVMLSAIVLIYFSKKLRDEAEAEAEN